MIQPDKQLHLLGGIVLSLVFGLLFGAWSGLAVAVMAGVGKEIYDMTGRGTPDIWDAVATIVGGIIGALLLLWLKCC